MSDKTSAIQEIRKLYERIPSFQCVPGCTDCCGPVPWAKSEWAQVKDKRKAKSINCCPYASSAGCDCYEYRPLICRLFGAADHPLLTCPHGCGPKEKLTDSEAREMIRMHGLFFGED